MLYAGVGEQIGPFERKCHACKHFVITGADYAYWLEAPGATLGRDGRRRSGRRAREYIYGTFRHSSQALAGLEKALLALGLLDHAKDIDPRSPQQDFFDLIWRQGWRAGDLVEIGCGETTDSDTPKLEQRSHLESQVAS